MISVYEIPGCYILQAAKKDTTCNINYKIIKLISFALFF